MGWLYRVHRTASLLVSMSSSVCKWCLTADRHEQFKLLRVTKAPGMQDPEAFQDACKHLTMQLSQCCESALENVESYLLKEFVLLSLRKVSALSLEGWVVRRMCSCIFAASITLLCMLKSK